MNVYKNSDITFSNYSARRMYSYAYVEKWIHFSREKLETVGI